MLPKDFPKELSMLKEAFAKMSTENLKGIKSVRYVEEFGKEKAKKKEASLNVKRAEEKK